MVSRPTRSVLDYRPQAAQTLGRAGVQPVEGGTTELEVGGPIGDVVLVHEPVEQVDVLSGQLDMSQCQSYL